MISMRKQPLHFRKEDVQIVMDRWKASESVSLVGVGSVGKSNLLQHLADSDTQKFYLGAERTEKFKSVMIDPNLLGAADDSSEQFRCWAGYELLMHRLYLAFFPFSVLGEDAPHFFEIYQTLQDGSNPLYAYMGLRYFELGLEFFFRRNIQICFMFDEFEEILRFMPVKFFLSLRGLRDNHKNLLSFLSFSREPLPVLVDKMKIPELAIEPFTELFTDNLYYVGPYNRDDAEAMLQNLMRRNPNVRYSNSTLEFLLYASGRYAGILRAGFRELEIIGDVTPSQVTDTNLVGQLARRLRVRTECETIWKGLTDIERRVLYAVAHRQFDKMDNDSELAVSLLVQKRLLHVNKTMQLLEIQPPVFNVYVASLV
jgi:hypothetical protein